MTTTINPHTQHQMNTHMPAKHKLFAWESKTNIWSTLTTCHVKTVQQSVHCYWVLIRTDETLQAEVRTNNERKVPGPTWITTDIPTAKQNLSKDRLSALCNLTSFWKKEYHHHPPPPPPPPPPTTITTTTTTNTITSTDQESSSVCWMQ